MNDGLSIWSTTLPDPNQFIEYHPRGKHPRLVTCEEIMTLKVHDS